MEMQKPWYFSQRYSIDHVEEILFDILNILSRLSKKTKLSDKTIQSYKEWLRPFILKNADFTSGLNNRECAQSYINCLKQKMRDFTYVVNVRLLLQKIFMFTPPLPKILQGELSDEIRTNEELYLTDKNVRAIRGWAEEHDSTNPDNYDELADYVTLILLTGARPFEARNLSLKQCIDLKEKCSTFIIGKGRAGRQIVCSNLVSTKRFLGALVDRIKHLNMSDSSLPIFSRPDRFYRRQFLKLQKFTLLFNNKKYSSLHSLRRAAARTLYSSKRDIQLVKNFLGHKRQATTERYLNTALPDLIKGVTDSEKQFH